MAKEGLANNENKNPVAETAESLGVHVTYPEIKTKSGKTIRIMKLEKRTPNKDLGLDCFGTAIMAYKAEGYSLVEFKKLLSDLGISDWMYFFPGEENKWPVSGPKGWRQILEPYPGQTVFP
jgi:hypothetical protein